MYTGVVGYKGTEAEAELVVVVHRDTEQQVRDQLPKAYAEWLRTSGEAKGDEFTPQADWNEILRLLEGTDGWDMLQEDMGNTGRFVLVFESI